MRIAHHLIAAYDNELFIPLRVWNVVSSPWFEEPSKIDEGVDLHVKMVHTNDMI